MKKIDWKRWRCGFGEEQRGRAGQRGKGTTSSTRNM